MKYTSIEEIQEHKGTFRGKECWCVNLEGQDFRLKDFRDVTFVCCDLRRTMFGVSDLRSARFSNCDMRNTYLEECDLRDTRFESCDLIGANFRKSDLTGTDFDIQSLRGATFGGAKGIAQVYIPNMSSRGEVLTAIMGSDGKVIIQTGCFKRSIEEFSTELSIQKRGGGIYEETAMLLCRGLQELISQ